jgi:phosphomannomutase
VVAACLDRGDHAGSENCSWAHCILASSAPTEEELVVDFSEFVKTYDVRGLVGTQLTDEVVRAFGAAFADELELLGSQLVVGYDMRDSSPGFAVAFAQGANLRGADVVMLGLCSTDMNYFASGSLKIPAVMFTASHNPASYNGIKFSRAGARGISMDTGLAAISQRAQVFLAEGIEAVSKPGKVIEQNLITEYVQYLRNLVDFSGAKKLKIVVDAANGMAGLTVPAVFGSSAGLDPLGFEIIPLYFELDGSFPNHEANPLQPENLRDLQAAVLKHGADLGLAFDGDADRCFAVDEKGQAVSPSALGAIVSKREIDRVKAQGEQGITVLHNLLTSRYVAEVIQSCGAVPYRTKVGHSLIKDAMAETNAVFGAEHSAHYYFRDFFGADNGMLAALHLVSELAASSLPMSALASNYTPYFASGEINSTVTDVPAAMARLETLFPDAQLDRLDGTTFSFDSAESWWWANIRSSNTEPLLRLNVESSHEALMVEIRDQAIQAIRNS